MSPDLLIALVGFAIVSSITPGPNNLLVMTSGLNFGVARSLPLVAGISFGFAIMLLAVGVGLGSVIRTSPGAHLAVKIFGLGYMLWLAWKVATSAPRVIGPEDGNASRPLSALTGVTFQWVNPKAWAVALSATAAFAAPEAMWASLFAILSVFAVVSLLSLSAWAAFGTLMRRLIDTPSKMVAFNIVMALLLVASAAPVAYDLLINR
ncbi:LysE family translocator [Hyphomicrobium sp. LHD-15]|uniref:LysE family translocator n=1 Tax=Hyphomicrobium sp. LHD-15 TaxID=3072142 RepID=UPI00280E2FE2|nr:LysE family translocator [Hyphomicrobium sp. LHD-15]MDQ8697459.1 LysE family translocator [Hyphomicrobium sp. LHD-15]